jgi:hypothetical protein
MRSVLSRPHTVTMRRARLPWRLVPYKIDNTDRERKRRETFMDLETRILTVQFRITTDIFCTGEIFVTFGFSSTDIIPRGRYFPFVLSCYVYLH